MAEFRQDLKSANAEYRLLVSYMKTHKLLFVIVLSAVLAAEEIPSRSALSVRGLNEALIRVAEDITPAVAMVTAEGYQQVAGDRLV